MSAARKRGGQGVGLLLCVYPCTACTCACKSCSLNSLYQIFFAPICRSAVRLGSATPTHGFRDPHAWHPQHSRTPQALAAWQLADRWDDRIRMSRNHCRAPSQAPGPALPPGAGRGSGQSCQDNRAPRLSQGPSLCRSGGAPQLPPQTEHRRPLVTQLFGPRQPTAAGATPRNRPGVRRLTPDGDHGPVLRRRQFEHAGVRRPLPVDGCTDHQP